jgi:hypothetical protein
MRPDDEATFESVYDAGSGRWTLRRLRVDREADTLPAPPTDSPKGELAGEQAPASPTAPVGPLHDLVVPVRRDGGGELEHDALDLGHAFLLMHVDGRSTIAEIACYTSRSVADVAASFAMLAAMGIIELVGDVAAEEPPRDSGVRRARR